MRRSKLSALVVCLAIGACQDECDETTGPPATLMTVTGTVTLDGAPLSGLTVQLRNYSTVLGSTTTGPKGEYSVSHSYSAFNRPSNPAVHVIGPPGIAFGDHPRPITGDNENADFEGTYAPTLSGAITANGVGVEDYLVLALHGFTLLSATTDASGRYAFGPIDPGTYTLSVGPPTGFPIHRLVPAARTVIVISGPYTVDFSVEFFSGPVEGRVTANGQGLPGIDVALDGPWSGTTVTDANGDYSFATAPPGNHTVTISGFDAAVYAFPSVSQSLTIASGQSGRADFDATIVGTNTPPVAGIIEPVDGSVIAFGAPVRFTGAATDAEDGLLSGQALVWTRDNGVALGTGTTFLADLDVGPHTITLTATDSDGLSASASAAVSVIVNQAPTVTIAQPAPDEVLTQGQAYTFTGSGTDTEDGALAGASLVWTSDQAGQIGTGTSFSFALAQTGYHNITLTGTDAAGATGSATVRIYVSPSESPVP